MANKNNLKKNGRASKKRLFFLISGIALICLSLFLVALASGIFDQDPNTKAYGELSSIDQEKRDSIIDYNGVLYQPKKNLETVVIMGIDTLLSEGDSITKEMKAIFRNNQQADFISLIVTDKKTGESRFIQINRDTMTNVPNYDAFGKRRGTVKSQIALAHTYGTGDNVSARNVAKAVTNLLGGIKVDHFVALTMDAVRDINDAVGGVTVTIDEDLTAIDPSFTKGSTVTLKGDQALNYVRARMSVGDGTNLSRMERQRTYLNALYDQLSSMDNKNSNFYVKLFMDIDPYMTSDMSVNSLSRFFSEVMDGKTGEIETISGTAQKGKYFMEFYPDEDQLQELIISVFYEPVPDQKQN